VLNVPAEDVIELAACHPWPQPTIDEAEAIFCYLCSCFLFLELLHFQYSHSFSSSSIFRGTHGCARVTSRHTSICDTRHVCATTTRSCGTQSSSHFYRLEKLIVVYLSNETESRSIPTTEHKGCQLYSGTVSCVARSAGSAATNVVVTFRKQRGESGSAARHIVFVQALNTSKYRCG
jgi:hypothetical protein